MEHFGGVDFDIKANADDTLDSTSANPVQNAVITGNFKDLIGHGSHIGNTNIDTLTHPGTYLCLANCTNIPNTNEWFTVNVFASGTGSYIQQAIGVSSNIMYYRHYDGNTWSSWRRNFNFGIDANGNYGYIKDGADTVTPFRSDLDATYLDGNSYNRSAVRSFSVNKGRYIVAISNGGASGSNYGTNTVSATGGEVTTISTKSMASATDASYNGFAGLNLSIVDITEDTGTISCSSSQGNHSTVQNVIIAKIELF